MRMLLVLALLCAPVLYAQNDPVRLPAPKKGQQHIADGEEAFTDGRMQDAVDAFTSALADQPENDEALGYRAAAYVALGKLDKADDDLAAAIKLNTDFSLTWNTRGYVRWLRGNHTGAIEDYNAALAYAGGDRRVDKAGLAQLHQNRGVAYQDLGNSDRALLDFNRCVELLPNNPAFLENRGLVYVDKELFDMAFRDFDASVELDRKNARAYVNRAYAARLMGDFEQAVRDYSQALRLKADYGQALIGRGYTWMGWGRDELAENDFKQARKIDGFQVSGYTGLGDLLRGNGKLADALEQYESAITVADGIPAQALRGKILVLEAQDQAESALSWCSALSLIEPTVPENWLIRARLAMKLANFEEVIASANCGLELQPSSNDLRRLRIQACAREGNYVVALYDAGVLKRFDKSMGCIESARVCTIAYADKQNTEALDEALDELRKAVGAGADLVSTVKDDPDFAPLKDNTEFKKLIGED
ncbi:MAG: tetratricopeptide repeat protein [Planctomycetes bacterium]|nr:tetratricopeptide repeat protein [Planctomycetota bacterium]